MSPGRPLGQSKLNTPTAGYRVEDRPIAGSGSFGTVAGAEASSGVIHANSPKGGRLRCSFTYSSWSSTGFGLCEDESGAIYDLVIE